MVLDPIDYAVVSQALIAAAREMGAKLIRSAYSTILREAAISDWLRIAYSTGSRRITRPSAGSGCPPCRGRRSSLPAPKRWTSSPRSGRARRPRR